jgi:hypothetical protein
MFMHVFVKHNSYIGVGVCNEMVALDRLPGKPFVCTSFSVQIMKLMMLYSGLRSSYVCHGDSIGWEQQSWGYHGDDGYIFSGHGKGQPFRTAFTTGYANSATGTTFTTGDTIGCGVNFQDMSLFYTKNGVYLGVAFRDLKGLLYPIVGMRSSGEIVEANFGQRDFMFNIEDYVRVRMWKI